MRAGPLFRFFGGYRELLLNKQGICLFNSRYCSSGYRYTLLSADNLADSLDPDQNRQNIGPETPIVDQNHLSADNLCK